MEINSEILDFLLGKLDHRLVIDDLIRHYPEVALSIFNGTYEKYVPIGDASNTKHYYTLPDAADWNTSSWINAARVLCQANHRIHAIKLIRDLTGVSLREVKEFVDKLSPPRNIG